MHDLPLSGRGDSYLIGPRQAWFAFAMTIALMIFDYVDRQVIVSLFPHLKAEWALSDTQLGALVSAVSVTVAIAGIPVALFADRVSRVGSIVAMQEKDVVTTTEHRCKTVNEKSQKVVGYNVTYRLDGKDGVVRMSFKPGPKLPVKDGQVVTTPPADNKA